MEDLEDYGLIRSFLLLFLFLISFLLIGSRPGINGVGMGCFHLPLEVEFPRAPNPPERSPSRGTNR
jgi:hypothetical protein